MAFFIYAFRKRLVTAMIAAVLAVVIAVVVKGPVFDACGVASPDFVESLSVPLQQVARVVVEHGDISDSDMALIEAVADKRYVWELYAPDYADKIKEIQRLIGIITEQGVTIRTGEERNRKIIEKVLGSRKTVIRKMRNSLKAASSYAQTMSPNFGNELSSMDDKK